MAELPDDAIEALCKTVGHALATHPRITGSALAALANTDGQTAVELRERVLTVIAGAAYPLIAARVRAAAVADERQRIARFILNTVDPLLPGPDVRLKCVAVVRTGEPLAAGSVPVATPEPDSVAELAKSCGECTEGGLGNCRHGCREPSDPTYGRIDPDIQRAVDELEPESLGSRVAMENTLQARRDAATPTGP